MNVTQAHNAATKTLASDEAIHSVVVEFVVRATGLTCALEVNRDNKARVLRGFANGLWIREGEWV